MSALKLLKSLPSGKYRMLKLKDRTRKQQQSIIPDGAHFIGFMHLYYLENTESRVMPVVYLENEREFMATSSILRAKQVAPGRVVLLTRNSLYLLTKEGES